MKMLQRRGNLWERVRERVAVDTSQPSSYDRRRKAFQQTEDSQNCRWSNRNKSSWRIYDEHLQINIYIREAPYSSPVFEWTYVFTSLGWMLWTRMVPHIVGVPRTFRQSVKLFTKATVPCVVSSALYESSSSSTCQQHNIVLNGFNLHFPSN